MGVNAEMNNVTTISVGSPNRQVAIPNANLSPQSQPQPVAAQQHIVNSAYRPNINTNVAPAPANSTSNGHQNGHSNGAGSSAGSRQDRRRQFAKQRLEQYLRGQANPTSTTPGQTARPPQPLLSPDGSPFNAEAMLEKMNSQPDLDVTSLLPDAISDDDQGNFQPLVGEEVYDRYVVQNTLGSGTFGVVLRCFDTTREDFVAVKIVRAHPSYTAQGKSEVAVLVKLAEWTRPHAFGNGLGNEQTPRRPQLNVSAPVQQALNDGADHVVKLRKNFMWRGHLCLVFELLSHTLYDLVRRSRYVGISLNLVGKFGVQLSKSLHMLNAAPQPIIHCDVKPENILLARANRSHIKLVDFGSSCFTHGEPKPRYVQSRFYRAPEVMLRVPYGTEIDVWSCACVLAELFTGKPLFGGRSEPDQLNRIQAVLGPIPKRLVDQSPKRGMFKLKRLSGGATHRSPYYFELIPLQAPAGGGQPVAPPARQGPDFSDHAWDDSLTLSTSEAAASLRATLIRNKMQRHRDAPSVPEVDDIDYQQLDVLCDMLSHMLIYDKRERMNPGQLLAHEFFRRHLVALQQSGSVAAPPS